MEASWRESDHKQEGMQQSPTAVRIWFSRIRAVAAWTTLVAFVSMFAAENILTTKYGARSWPDPASRPGFLEWLLFWRNGSFGFGVAGRTHLIAAMAIVGWFGSDYRVHVFLGDQLLAFRYSLAA